jgi:hypothetical protein
VAVFAFGVLAGAGIAALVKSSTGTGIYTALASNWFSTSGRTD